MVDKHSIIDYLLLAIFVVSLLSSLALVSKSSSGFCVSPTSCDLVQSSEYAYTFGIKNNYYGVVAFAILTVMTVLHILKPSVEKARVIKAGVIFGSLIAIYFIFLQVFVIKAFCTYCMVIDVSLILGLILVILHSRKSLWKGS